jgi:hypothetical protein
VAVAGCAPAFRDRTFEPGVEHHPGPSAVILRILPAQTTDGGRIALFMDDGHQMHTFLATDGQDRYVTTTTLPARIVVTVDGSPCGEPILLGGSQEVDATLTVGAGSCAVVIDQVHPYGAVDHRLEDFPVKDVQR